MCLSCTAMAVSGGTIRSRNRTTASRVHVITLQQHLSFNFAVTHLPFSNLQAKQFVLVSAMRTNRVDAVTVSAVYSRSYIACV